MTIPPIEPPTDRPPRPRRVWSYPPGTGCFVALFTTLLIWLLVGLLFRPAWWPWWPF